MKHGYSSLQISLHWTVAALVLVNWFLGGGMEETFEALQDGEEVRALGAAYSHVAIGLAVLLTMIGRLAARMARPVATAPDAAYPILATLGRINHWAFYALLILIPIGGAVAWFGGNEGAGNVHKLAVQVMVVLIVVHVGAALLHQFILRDGLIRRMIRPTGGT